MPKSRITPHEEAAKILEGTEELITPEELLAKIERARRERRPLQVKYGADPSAPDIHLGHAVSLFKLKELQELGHHIVFLIGDFTGMIGDPSGRTKTRPVLSREEVEKNAETYKEQVSKILDVERTEIAYNSTWNSALNFEQVIRLCSSTTVARMLERDDFARRYKNEVPISLHEFLYPVAQAYDSVVLRADLEMGGSDQKFNFLLAREMQKDHGQEAQIVITMPLLVGTDGVQKMSKSLDNYICITEDAVNIYGKVMSIPDSALESYIRLASRLPKAKMEKMLAELKDGSAHPMEIKKRLAYTITALYAGDEGARRGEEEFTRIFQAGEDPSAMPLLNIDADAGQIWIVKLICAVGFARTNGEARRLVLQGAVSLDGELVSNADVNVDIATERVLRVGKRRFVRVMAKGG